MNPNEILSRQDLLTDCERSMRYHQARSRFLNTAHLFIQFLVFAFASAGVSNLILNSLTSEATRWLWALIAVLALFSLVYNPAEKSALHRSLYRGFTILAGTIAATTEADTTTLAGWTKTIHALYAEEPPVYRALLAHCDNQVAIAMNADPGYFVDLSWYHRLLRNLWAFQGTEFLNRNQANEVSVRHA